MQRGRTRRSKARLPQNRAFYDDIRGSGTDDSGHVRHGRSRWQEEKGTLLWRQKALEPVRGALFLRHTWPHPWRYWWEGAGCHL